MGQMKEFTGLHYRDGEISETLMMAMRGAARATWSTIKHIPGLEDLAKEWKTVYERQHGK